MRSRPATQVTPARPASSGLPPAAQNLHHVPCDDGGHPAAGPDTGLDAYIAWLAGQAPPLSREQRDTLALILRRTRTPARPPAAGTPDPMPQQVYPFHG